jgi:hypothetical protein
MYTQQAAVIRFILFFLNFYVCILIVVGCKRDNIYFGFSMRH